jgi:hypothetical protein|tara:strand:+ start:1478 stop:1804 length:327 start_codon:yes stop_codon:yes gene_type:complete
MSKLLETKLPTAQGQVNADTFNRLSRVLELSLNSVDVDSTLSVNETQRNLNFFNKGDIIFNLSTEQLQLWTGTEWIDLYIGEEKGLEAIASLGVVSVSTGGSTTVKIL